MKVVVVLNGEPPRPERLRALVERFPVFAADGGARTCLEAGVRPEVVVGDFDSVSRGDLPEGWECREDPDQHDTDFEKVLRHVPEATEEVWVLGGLGKRLDHVITNLLIAAGLPDSLRIGFEDDAQWIRRVTRACPFEAEPPAGSLLSLWPVPGAEGVRSTGLRWNLEGVAMGPGAELGQSNRVEGPVRVTVERGCLFAWTPV